VDPVTGDIDYDALEKQLLALPAEKRPRMLVLGGTAVTVQIDWARAAAIARRVTEQNEKDGRPGTMLLLADISHNLGQILVGEYNSPFPHADFITSTTQKSGGPRSAFILSRSELFSEVNKHLALEGKAAKRTLADLVDMAILPGSQGGPKFHDIAAKTVMGLVLQSKEWLDGYARQLLPNARALAMALEMLDPRVKLIGPVKPETHLLLMDVRPFGLTGKQAEVLNKILDDIYLRHQVREDRLKELLGHTPIEVMAGAFLGPAFSQGEVEHRLAGRASLLPDDRRCDGGGSPRPDDGGAAHAAAGSRLGEPSGRAGGGGHGDAAHGPGPGQAGRGPLCHGGLAGHRSRPRG